MDIWGGWVNQEEQYILECHHLLTSEVLSAYGIQHLDNITHVFNTCASRWIQQGFITHNDCISLQHQICLAHTSLGYDTQIENGSINRAYWSTPQHAIIDQIFKKINQTPHLVEQEAELDRLQQLANHTKITYSELYN